MNPPFGEVSAASSSYVKQHYPKLCVNIFSAFIERGLNMSKGGRLGAITDSTWVKKTDYKAFREMMASVDGNVESVIDMGWGVLDDANVSTSTYVCSPGKVNPDVIFINVKQIELESKQSNLLEVIHKVSMGKDSEYIFLRNFEYFSNFDNLVFAYESPEAYVKAFQKWGKLGSSFGEARRGYSPGDTFRFFRCFWETSINGFGTTWKLLNNGGAYRPIIGDGFMTAKYTKDWNEYRSLPGFRLESEPWIGKPGIGWGKRTDYMYCYPFPEGSMFSNEGQCFFPFGDKWDCIGLLNSALGQALVNLITGQHKLAGYVGKIPVPADEELLQEIGKIAQDIFILAFENGSYQETSHHFNPNFFESNSFDATLLRSKNANNSYAAAFEELNRISLCAVNSTGIYEKTNNLCKESFIVPFSRAIESNLVNEFISYLIGKLIGRWTDFVPQKDPFKEVSNSYVRKFFSAHVDIFTFNERVSKGTNLVPDEALRKEYASWYEGILNYLGDLDLVDYINQPMRFFDFHLKQYSKSRRQAPVYWPLQTLSGSYTVWVYYHRLNEQTLFTCVNDFVGPKLESVNKDLATLKNKLLRSKDEEKEFGRLTDLKVELEDFRDELLRIAKFWKPNLNDGVQITAAPLWRLFKHIAWQNKLKETWKKLEEGEYDWAYLAYSIWPARVLRKCHKDRSLAIAHEVEDDLWHEVEVIKPRKKLPVWEWQPKPLSESQLNAYIQTKIQAQGTVA
jgi:hypothetical protein